MGLQILAVAADAPVLMFVFLLYAFGLLIPSLAVGVRRMQDLGKSRWYLLVPFYNLILAFTEGDHLDNQYGRNPKAMKETTLQNI